MVAQSVMIAELRAAEAERQRALVTPDLAALERILADDLIHIHSTAAIHDKQGLIAHVARMGGFVSIERGPLDIRPLGEVALVLGQTVNTVRRIETGEIARLEGFATLLYRRGPQGWQVLLSQLTPARQPAGAPPPDRTRNRP